MWWGVAQTPVVAVLLAIILRAGGDKPPVGNGASTAESAECKDLMAASWCESVLKMGSEAELCAKVHIRTACSKTCKVCAPAESALPPQHQPPKSTAAEGQDETKGGVAQAPAKGGVLAAAAADAATSTEAITEEAGPATKEAATEEAAGAGACSSDPTSPQEAGAAAELARQAAENDSKATAAAAAAAVDADADADVEAEAEAEAETELKLRMAAAAAEKLDVDEQEQEMQRDLERDLEREREQEWERERERGRPTPPTAAERDAAVAARRQERDLWRNTSVIDLGTSLTGMTLPPPPAVSVLILYANWCAVSRKFAVVADKVAKRLAGCLHCPGSAKVYAIDCWEPAGECKKAASLAAFPQVQIKTTNSSYMYNGQLTEDAIMSYIARVANPAVHVGSLDQALDLMQQHGNNIAVFGYFPDSGGGEITLNDGAGDVHGDPRSVFQAVAARWAEGYTGPAIPQFGIVTSVSLADRLQLGHHDTVAIRTSGGEVGGGGGGGSTNGAGAGGEWHNAPAEALETVHLLSNWTATAVTKIRTISVLAWETYAEVLYGEASGAGGNEGGSTNGSSSSSSSRQPGGGDAPMPHAVLVLPLPPAWANAGLYLDADVYAAPSHHATLLRRYWEVARAYPGIKFSVFDSRGLPVVLPRLGLSEGVTAAFAIINTTTANATVLVESDAAGTAAYNTGALWVVEALTFLEVQLFVEDYATHTLFRDYDKQPADGAGGVDDNDNGGGGGDGGGGNGGSEGAEAGVEGGSEKAGEAQSPALINEGQPRAEEAAEEVGPEAGKGSGGGSGGGDSGVEHTHEHKHEHEHEHEHEHRHEQSGSKTEENAVHARGEVVELTSKELVQAIGQSKYVLLQLYAPWCGFCKGMEPAYDALAAAFGSAAQLVVARLNTDTAFVPEAYDSMWSELPTLLLFGGISGGGGSSGGSSGSVAGSGGPIKYGSNHRELHRLIQFVEDHTNLRAAV